MRAIATATATAIEAKNRSGDLCAQVKREKVTRAARKKAFEAEFADWIDAQNAHFKTRGIPGAPVVNGWPIYCNGIEAMTVVPGPGSAWANMAATGRGRVKTPSGGPNPLAHAEKRHLGPSERSSLE